MSNHLRIVYDNAADRSSISATSTAGSLAPANLLTDYKSDIYRSVGTSTTITLTWAVAEFVGMVALPFCNLTSSATIRVKLYTNVADASPIYDTGVVSACAAAPLGAWDWGNVPLGVNAYSYVGAAYGRVWFTAYPVKKVEVIVSDSTNPSGYIEASRIVAGAYFSPERNAELDATIEPVETSSQMRNDASDLITDLGIKSKKISFSLQHMTIADKNSVFNVLRGNGMGRPIFVSLYPDDDDATEEQMFQIYGKIPQQSSVNLGYWKTYNTKIDIEEM